MHNVEQQGLDDVREGVVMPKVHGESVMRGGEVRPTSSCPYAVRWVVVLAGRWLYGVQCVNGLMGGAGWGGHTYELAGADRCLAGRGECHNRVSTRPAIYIAESPMQVGRCLETALKVLRCHGDEQLAYMHRSASRHSSSQHAWTTARHACFVQLKDDSVAAIGKKPVT